MWTDKPPKKVENGIVCFTQEECAAYTEKVFRLKNKLVPVENTFTKMNFHYQGKVPENSYVIPVEHFPELHDMGLKILPLMERAVFKKLYPTYIYSRLYYPGYELCRHTDRPSCEYSVSVTMGMGDREEPWKLFYESYDYDYVEFDLPVGKGMVYPGCIAPHWRAPLEKGWQLQAFFHYIEYKGQYYHDALRLSKNAFDAGQFPEPYDFSKPWTDPQALRFYQRPNWFYPQGSTFLDLPSDLAS